MRYHLVMVQESVAIRVLTLLLLTSVVQTPVHDHTTGLRCDCPNIDMPNTKIVHLGFQVETMPVMILIRHDLIMINTIIQRIFVFSLQKPTTTTTTTTTNNNIA